MRKKVFRRTEKEMFVCLKKRKPVLFKSKTMNELYIRITGDDNSASSEILNTQMHLYLPITSKTKAKCRNSILLNPFTSPVQTLLTFNYLLILILTCILINTNLTSGELRVNKVVAPAKVREGQPVILHCQYVIVNETLRTVKWFKDSREFYRFTPNAASVRDKRIAFPCPGISVDVHRSSDSQVQLAAVGKAGSGTYRCEVSAELSFRSASGTANMEVANGNQSALNSRSTSSSSSSSSGSAFGRRPTSAGASQRSSGVKQAHLVTDIGTGDRSVQLRPSLGSSSQSSGCQHLSEPSYKFVVILIAYYVCVIVQTKLFTD